MLLHFRFRLYGLQMIPLPISITKQNIIGFWISDGGINFNEDESNKSKHVTILYYAEFILKSKPIKKGGNIYEKYFFKW